MEDLKQKLINAGFKEESIRWESSAGWDLFLDINLEDKAKYTIAVNISTMRYCVQRISTTIINEPFKDENHLSKLIFAFTRKDLDFEPKKDYSWKGIFDKMTTVEHNAFLHLVQGLHDIKTIPAIHKLSITAGIKLRIVIAKINADFPTKGSYMFYPIINENGVLTFQSGGEKERPNNLGCNNGNGFDKLLETNRPLLEQYFMIDKNSEE